VSPELQSLPILRRLVIGAAFAATAAHYGAVLDDRSPWIFPVAFLLTVVLTLLAARWCTGRFQRIETVPAVTPVILLLFLAPFCIEGGLRLAGYPVNPLEVVLISAVLLVGLGLSVASSCVAFQPLAMICNLFVSLFAASITTHPITYVASAVFLIVGGAWLAFRHWSTITRTAQQRGKERRSPWKSVMVGLALLLVPLAGIGWVGADRIWSLSGWVPSSGGDSWADPTARSGVGNGDALVAGQEDIQSFGPIEDAPFRASEDPSLYDLFNDSYDEPVKISNQDRAFALPPEMATAMEQAMAKSQKAGKEFSTARKSRSKSKSTMTDLASSALFYVKGRTPLHLRHEVFDLFDGVTWSAVDSEGEPSSTPLSMITRGDRPWLSWPSFASAMEYLAAEEPHAVKVVHLKSNRFPAPNHLKGIHIDRLNDVSFFHWDGGDLLRMDRQSLPELTAIHYRSQAVDWERLGSDKHWGTVADQRYMAVPVGGDFDRINQLAQQWTAGKSRGWPQIEAIVNELRTKYVHDRAAKPAEETPCPVAEFLFESKRGPEYQFATAAAIMLRSLGYSTRLVGGFYASDKRYDTRQQHTAVLADDTHVWLEVFHRSRTWITVDPTPGFQVLGPPPTFWQKSYRLLVATAYWLLARWVLVAGLAVAGVAMWLARFVLLDRLLVAWWQVMPQRDVRGRLIQTIRLIDRRLTIGQQPRPPSCPPIEWYQKVSLPVEADRQPLLRLAQLADWAAYAPVDSGAKPELKSEIDSVCQQAVSNVSPRFWK
jgi:protein-glutamine gamma-glutamyltransferase